MKQPKSSPRAEAAGTAPPRALSAGQFYLGLDGGQSHTTALVADGQGRILGVGHAGESNHTRAPGGRERLINAVTHAVLPALAQAGVPVTSLAQYKFASAVLALTGEPADKRAIVAEILQAEVCEVSHDAPGALAGALAGGEGVLVLAGTGSVACGEIRQADGTLKYARVGGRGYLFADEGSAFAIARQAVAHALQRADRCDGMDTLQLYLLKHFKRNELTAISEDVYAGVISREQLAGFAARVASLAERREPVARAIMDQAAAALAELAVATARRLQCTKALQVSYGGGVFKNKRLLEQFKKEIAVQLPKAQVVAPRFAPDIGALLLAYRLAGKRITPALLTNLTSTQSIRGAKTT